MDSIRIDDMLKESDDTTKQKPKQRKIENNSNYSPKKTRRPRNVWKIVSAIAIFVLILGLASWGIYSYLEIEKMRSPEYVEQQAEQEKQILIDKLGKLMELPDEEAVIATVTDKAKLKDQPFFEKAENGDKVLIFSESSMAIIYRESTDKIINSGPIAITSAEEIEEQ